MPWNYWDSQICHCHPGLQTTLSWVMFNYGPQHLSKHPENSLLCKTKLPTMTDHSLLNEPRSHSAADEIQHSCESQAQLPAPWLEPLLRESSALKMATLVTGRRLMF